MAEAKRFDSIDIKKQNGLGWITFNRPHRLNSMTEEMMDEISAALDQFEKDPEVRCIALTGTGERAFSTGADVTAFTGLTPVKAVEIATKGQEMISKLEKTGKPAIAAINGYALGGGLEIALACDFRIAVEHAELGHTEVRMGLIPGWGGTQRLPRIVGLTKAKELILTGNRITAQEAEKIGLINKIVPKEKLEEETRNYAQPFIEGPPIALRLAKHALNFSTQAPLDAGLKLEAEVFGLNLSTKDVMEGVSAFVSKRKPEFKGK